MSAERLWALRRAAAVRRWHTASVTRKQTLAEHSHGVAMLMSMVHPNPSYAVVMAALTHDLAEYATGDIPAHIKWDSPIINAEIERIEVEWLKEAELPFVEGLDAFDRNALHFCDSFELMLWAIEEGELGNTFAVKILKRITPRIAAMEMPSETAKSLFNSACRSAHTIIMRLS